MTDVLFRRGRYLALSLIMIVTLGAFAFQSIGRQEDPTITNIFATILTPYPGAAPDRVEALVTEKIEEELREIPEIVEITATSRTGISSIQVELSSFIDDVEIERTWSEIRDALTDVARELPAGVPEPEFDNDRTGAYTAIVTVTGASPAVMGRHGEDLAEDLRAIPNTSLVKVFGAPEEEIRVEIDADVLASLGLTPDAVAARIAAADAKVSAGRVRGVGSDYLIEVTGEITSLARIAEVTVTTGPDGRSARVGDIGRVLRATAEPPAEVALAGGDRAILVAARIENDVQTDVWSGFVREDVAAFQAALPAGLAAELVFDQSTYTADRLAEVAGNLALGVAIVVVVLFLTMGWRSALVVGLALPLTSLMTLTVLQWIGLSIHQMSVTGLIVALGLLVDAAIVTTDEIRRRLLGGATRQEAVQGTVKRLAVPLLASTVTTVLAFMPMALLPGPAGDFVGAIAISVIVMLIASLLLALTVTPAIAGRLLPERQARHRWWRDGIAGGPLGRVFAASLRLSLRWRGPALLAGMAPAVLGFLAFPTLTAQFFPSVERDQFHVQLEMAPGTALDATQAAAEAADAILRGTGGIEAVQWVVGASAPPFYYNMQANRDGDPTFAEALVTTSDPATTEAVIPALQARLDAALPGVRVLVRGLKQGPPVNAPLEMRIVGRDLETLRTLGEEARRVMATVPAVTQTRADLSGGAPKLVFDLDEDKVRAAGLDLGDVARQLQTLTEGATGGSLVEGPEELPVRVRAGQDARASADALAALTVVAPGGADFIPLAALGEVRLAPSDGLIQRRNGERVNTIQGFLVRGTLPDEALATLQARLAESPIALPAGYRIEWGGESDARGETVGNLMSVVGTVVVATLATILLTFNSWRLSAVTLVVSVLSIGLSLLSLEVMGFPFGINALIGVIGAIGVSINAAIIIMTALQEDPEADRGDPEAIAAVVLGSARHIVSTTITTFGGFLPLLLAGGGFWPPFAMAIAGGVLLSTVVSFYVVPPAYSLLIGRPRAAAEPVPAAVPVLRAAE